MTGGVSIAIDGCRPKEAVLEGKTGRFKLLPKDCVLSKNVGVDWIDSLAVMLALPRDGGTCKVVLRLPFREMAGTLTWI